MFVTISASSQSQWSRRVTEDYPHAVLISDGTRIWAQVPGASGAVDVGYWSIVGGAGTVKPVPNAASCRPQLC